MITKIIIGLFVGIGLFMILADHFRIPYMRTSKAVSNLAKQQKDKTSSIDVWLSSFASFIARHLKLNEYKKQQLEMDLRTAQMNISPEMFMANAIVKSLIIAVFAIPVLFIFGGVGNGRKAWRAFLGCAGKCCCSPWGCKESDTTEQLN